MTPAEMREMAAKVADFYVSIFNHLPETTASLRESDVTGRTTAAGIAADIRAIPIPDTTAANDALEKARDEWERKYNAIVMGADPNASGTAKEYRAAVERACDDALGRYKHEAREAKAALVQAREALSACIHDTARWSKRCQEALAAIDAAKAKGGG